MTDLKKTLWAIGAVSVLTAILLSAWPHRAYAEDVAAGRRLAESWCSSCHLVASGPDRCVSSGAPTFVAFAQQKSTTILSLRVFLQTPHGQTPDLHLSRNEIDDLAAYILSLRTGGTL